MTLIFNYKVYFLPGIDEDLRNVQILILPASARDVKKAEWSEYQPLPQNALLVKFGFEVIKQGRCRIEVVFDEQDGITIVFLKHQHFWRA